MFAVGLIFVLYDTPPRKTQAESFNKVQQKVEIPKPKAEQANETSKMQAPVEHKQPEAPQPTAPAPKPVQPKVVEVPRKVLGTNEAMQFIFAHESSNNSHSINTSSGACGLGQAYPCSKLLNACGSLSNVECQVQFFTNYAVQRYGSWQNAMYFWQSNHWW